MDEILRDIEHRTAQIVEALSSTPLVAPSTLPDWSLLTLACHLRFGALALDRLTGLALEGEPAAYYWLGREEQRSATLEPDPGESAADVVRSLEEHAAALAARWRAVPADAWDEPVHEPPDRPDLGHIPLRSFAILRWTEVEVHGSDLGLDLPDWSEAFVRVALPFRLARLRSRGTGREASWLLDATDGEATLVEVDDTLVTTWAPASAADDPDATIRASSRDLLALVLGRPCVDAPELGRDVALAASFSEVFPGP